MKKRHALLAFTLLFLTGSLYAQSLGLPPGKWWSNPRTAAKLGLSAEQQEELEGIFHRSAAELIDRKANLGKATVVLRGLLDSDQLDRSAILEAAAEVSEARAALFERELALLVDLRTVLTTEQWNRIRTAIHERMEHREDPRHRRKSRRPHR